MSPNRPWVTAAWGWVTAAWVPGMAGWVLGMVNSERSSDKAARGMVM